MVAIDDARLDALDVCRRIRNLIAIREEQKKGFTACISLRHNRDARNAKERLIYSVHRFR